MNFGAVDGVSLRSGYALPACRPVNGGFINRRTVHLSKPKRCLDKPGHLFQQLLWLVAASEVSLNSNEAGFKGLQLLATSFLIN